MNIVCLDMEGVLVPEIWIAFAEESGIPELKRTTRDEPDYDKLMKWRLEILKEHGLGLKEIQATIAKIDPLPGAKEFLDELRTLTQVVILSDTFEQFAKPLMAKLNWPTIFCNTLEVAPDGTVLPCISQGDGWVKTTYNGKTGYVSQDYLLVPVTVRASTGLNLRASASETAEKLLTIPNGTVVQCYGNKENEWARVAYNGKAGYVSYLYIAYD